MDLLTAAALPETYFTVWTNVFEAGGLTAGQTMLVHGGTSGIGTTTIQLATAFGARVFATAGSAEKCAACVRLGAEYAVNYRTEDFVAVLRDRTGGRGVDLILDMVGGDYVARNLELLGRGGRLVQIGLIAGREASLDMWPIMQKHLIVTGSLLRPRSVEEKGAIADALRARVWPLLARGIAHPVLHATLPLAEAADAHRMLEASTHIGKIVLVVPSNAER
jgi:putative PIG3 family NAD(P)H quinone oxidoreductase